MFMLIGMWLCIFYCIIEYLLKGASTLAIIFYSFIIFTFFTLIGSDAGHIGLGMVLGLIFSVAGVAFAFEGKRRVSEENIGNTIREIEKQNRYDDNWGFNDFNN